MSVAVRLTASVCGPVSDPRRAGRAAPVGRHTTATLRERPLASGREDAWPTIVLPSLLAATAVPYARGASGSIGKRLIPSPSVKRNARASFPTPLCPTATSEFGETPAPKLRSKVVSPSGAAFGRNPNPFRSCLTLVGGDRLSFSVPVPVPWSFVAFTVTEYDPGRTARGSVQVPVMMPALLIWKPAGSPVAENESANPRRVPIWRENGTPSLTVPGARSSGSGGEGWQSSLPFFHPG